MLPRRVSVVGVAGAGKSTFADRLARVLGVRHVELDSIHHLPDWEPLPPEEFRDEIERTVGNGEGWVIDGNYSAVRDIVWDAADTVVWLDMPRRSYMPALMNRSLRRVLRRQELWNGNRERFANLVDRRPEENVVLWGWKTYETMRDRYSAAMEDPRWSHLTFVRLRSRSEMDDWLVRPRTVSSSP